MDIIDDFIKQYEKEYDFYKQLARLGHDILETEIINRGLKAMISSRAKRIDSLKEKLNKRNVTKQYNSKSEIENDIPDFAGIRVALYFPSDRKIVGETIDEIFEVIESKEFPENPHIPKFGKRFSGYWATHYRVKLKKSDDANKRFTDTIFEIQIASVLMHAWSEVEHDLVYKPLSGDLSTEELSILDEINGLVLSGEIALERLQKAITERTAKQEEITDKYQLTNFIHSNYNRLIENNLDFGNTEYLNTYLKAVEKLKTSDLIDTFNNINLNIKDSFSDQILQNLIISTENSENLKKYFSQFTDDKKKISGFELFTKTWIIFEKIIFRLGTQIGIDNKKNYVPSLESIKRISEFTDNEISQIQKLRNIRNELLHGYQSYSDVELRNAYDELMELVKKSLDKISDNNYKEKISSELI